MAIKKIDEQAAPSDAELALMQEHEDNALATVGANTVPLGRVEGDVGDVNMRFPYLKVSSAMGKLQAFTKGSIVINDDSLLALPGQPIRLTILAAQYYWKEYLSGTNYNPTVYPKRFATKEEVFAAGGTIDWTGPKEARVPPSYKIAVASKVLVQKPEGVVCGLFGIPIKGPDDLYAAAIWDVDKTGAAEVAPVIKRDSEFALRDRLYCGIYEITTKSKTFKSGYSSFVPVMKLVGFHDDVAKKQIEKFFGDVIKEKIDISEVPNEE
jgi:hypothetical protein